MRFPLLGALVLASTLAAQAQTGVALTGKMAAYNYLFGSTWTCKTTMSGIPPGAPTSTAGTVSFDAVDESTLHLHVSAPHYAADSYFSYAPKEDEFWSTSADSMGMAGIERSKDGKMYAGTGLMGGSNAPIEDRFTRVADNHIVVHSSATVNGTTHVSHADCTR
jgi:hypothetical protein